MFDFSSKSFIYPTERAKSTPTKAEQINTKKRAG